MTKVIAFWLTEDKQPKFRHIDELQIRRYCSDFRFAFETLEEKEIGCIISGCWNNTPFKMQKIEE